MAVRYWEDTKLDDPISSKVLTPAFEVTAGTVSVDVETRVTSCAKILTHAHATAMPDPVPEVACMCQGLRFVRQFKPEMNSWIRLNVAEITLDAATVEGVFFDPLPENAAHGSIVNRRNMKSQMQEVLLQLVNTKRDAAAVAVFAHSSD